MPTISYYTNAKDNTGTTAELDAELKKIRDGEYQNIVTQYRALIKQYGKDDERSKNFKASQVPAITVSGLFPQKRRGADLGEHSGYIAMDFDDIEDIAEARKTLMQDQYTYAVFTSISGGGLCAVVPIERAKHRDAFLGLERYYFKQYGYQVDQSGKDVSRCRFVSYDPETAFNPDARRFKEYIPKQKGRKPKIKPVISSDEDLEHVLRQIEANRIDLTEDYSTWVNLAFAFQSEYQQQGEDYFIRVSQFHPGFDEEKARRKYRSCTGATKTTIATFYYHAKQAGCDTVTDTSRHVAKIAKYAKKRRAKPEDAVKQLAEMDNIPPERSEKIVQSVYDSAELFRTADEDEDTVTKIEDCIRREFKIVYNEVTLKYEQDDKPLTDRDFNTIYIYIKKLIPEATKDLVMSCIDSDITPVVNPVHDWLRNAKYEGSGFIRQLADTIETPTGLSHENFFPNYAYHFIRKWMIGAVAMWMKKHSPLMLVLAGATQNTGKTHWFRYLLPNKMQKYFGEAELTGDKDENLMMCNKMMILNDEMSNKTKRDITVMKKLCSTQWFNLRKPYGRLSEDFRRIAALAGTSNSLEVISDPTGNRRIIPIEVLSINHEAYNAIDKDALWAEAYKAYLDGEEYQLGAHDIKKLESSTEAFQEASLEAELVAKYFALPKKGDEGEYMSNSEIKARIEVLTHQRLNQRKLGMELKALGFEKRSMRTESGKVKQAYQVVLKHGNSKSGGLTTAMDEYGT